MSLYTRALRREHDGTWQMLDNEILSARIFSLSLRGDFMYIDILCFLRLTFRLTGKFNTRITTFKKRTANHSSLQFIYRYSANICAFSLI